MKFTVQTTGCTNPGLVRTNNEDRFGVVTTKNQEIVLFVADGMGGHSAGEVASGHMADMIQHAFSGKTSLEDTWGSASKDSPDYFSDEFLYHVVEKGNSKIFHHAMDDIEKRGMGTTLTLSVIQDNQLKIIQVGDSRAYLIRKKKIQLLTKDHSLVQHEVDLGLITPEEALWDPRKNIITKAVGIIAKVEPDIYHYTLEPKDRILLCSDGLYDLVSEEELLLLSQKKNLNECVERLIEKANAYGGKDNVTVVMAEINGSNGAKKQDRKLTGFKLFNKRKKED